jgi:hypothetical protein
MIDVCLPLSHLFSFLMGPFLGGATLVFASPVVRNVTLAIARLDAYNHFGIGK